MDSNQRKRTNFTKSVEYDDKEDVYYVKSVTTGERYMVNRLKDNNHWFCTCKGYLYSAGNPKKCKHTQRIRVIDQLYKKYADRITSMGLNDD
ncbi:MAG: hypothetical protein AB7U98_02635 [Candidatus Nitrosocosmicus sp.]|jgi:hypothetical protein|uniref:hypothetical protein n=1 Tax=Candidatus Nitrosocosmicus sp. FF01 TaxID=3397670 RepID=UPI002A70CE6C|nr:hypothetical protein [Candidatus Nitrosocosmicus sp.]GKS61175.1 hypothetical protein YTPLAS21_06330 [Candidatus Nitrosocosmicus sp.]